MKKIFLSAHFPVFSAKFFLSLPHALGKNTWHGLAHPNSKPEKKQIQGEIAHDQRAADVMEIIITTQIADKLV